MTNENKIKSNWLLNINLFFLAVIIFLLPVNQQIIAPFIGLWGISSIVTIPIKKHRFQLNKSMLFLMLFYLLLIIGLAWTDNMKSGLFDLEVKMSLFIFPLFFSFLEYSKNQIRFLMYALYLGLIFGLGVMVYYAILKYIEFPSVNYFFYVYLSDKIHPSYLSYYIVIAFVVLLTDLKYKVLNIFKYSWQYIIILLFLFLFNILLLSKIGIAVACIFLLYFLILWAINKNKYFQMILIIFLLSTIFIFSYRSSSYVRQRTLEFTESFKSDNSINSSTNIRSKIWIQSLNLIKSQPILGYGTGDVKDVLIKQYRETDLNDAAEKKLNAHNQYLQITISVGIIGLAIFLLMLYFGFKSGLNNKNYILIGFITLTLMFLFPESMLENQAGTIAFGLFISLFNQKSLFNELS